MARKPVQRVSDYLDELLPVRRGERDAEGLKLVDPQRIKVLPQARKTFSEESLADMRESIAEQRRDGLGIGGTGILQPLLVRPDPNAPSGEAGYILTAGERRLRAAEFLKLPEVPVIVSEVGDESQARTQGQIRTQQLIENLQREDLPPLETAIAVNELKELENLSIRNLATRLGRGKGWVEDHVRLAKMPPDLQRLVSGRPDTLTHAREIDRLPLSDLRDELIRAAAGGAALTIIRDRVEKALTPTSTTTTSTTSSSTNAGSGSGSGSNSNRSGASPAATTAPASQGVGFVQAPTGSSGSSGNTSTQPYLRQAEELIEQATDRLSKWSSAGAEKGQSRYQLEFLERKHAALGAQIKRIKGELKDGT